MLNLAAFRYRNILAADGGPIQSLQVSEQPGLGVRQFQANARLRDDLVPRRRALAIYGSVDGTGTHASPMVARFKAISEALERWAYRATSTGPDRAAFGFDLDPSSNGMAAFPGLSVARARTIARYEAIERASLFDWWEGRCDGELIATDTPGIQAVRIANPLNEGVTVIVFRECASGHFAYGHAAAATEREACDRAIGELLRSSLVLCHYQLAVIAGRAEAPTDRFERRCLFFSTTEGHELFQQRLAEPARATRRPWRVVCDRAIPGPWSRYAHVWRVVIPAPTPDFLTAGERYFFW
jgi:hypothetical protein